MATTTLTFSDLVEETLSVLYRHTERPRRLAVGANALDNATDTTLTVDDPSVVAVTHLLEFVSDGEQALVTGKDGSDVLTVSRAYNNTTANGGHATTTELELNPQFGRVEVDRWVRRFFTSVAEPYLPQLTTGIFYRNTGEQVVELPADVRDVVSVRAQGTTGRIVDVAGWQLERDIPTSIYTSGVVLRTPVTVDDDDELWVTYTSPYDTTGTTISCPLGAEDLPVLFAAAYAVGRREVSRMDLDSIQEWNQAAAIRNGQNIRLMRELWGEFYRRLDEARKVQRIPKHRPFRKMPKIR